MRIKTLAIAAISLMGLVAPASAGAVTYIGSGSVAAQPVLQALFAAYRRQSATQRAHRCSVFCHHDK